MEIALVDGHRSIVQPGLKGVCQVCGQETVSKCGPKNIWHWAHKGKRHCDTWWENETPWHKFWKSQFPVEQQEIVHFDEKSGEKHIADVKTARGLVIELQNSPMPLEELKSREAFYGHMIWIVNADPFKSQFQVSNHRLPDPQSEMMKDLVFEETTEMNELLFWRKSECREGSSMVQCHPAREIQREVDINYRGHHFFKWFHPRTVWFDATAPVFLDFGDDKVLWLKRYGDSHSRCVQRFSKRMLVEKYGGKYVPQPF